MRLLPIISLHPEMTHAHPLTTPTPEGSKNKTERAESKAGSIASFFNFSEKLDKYVVFVAFKVPDMKTTRPDGTMRADRDDSVIIHPCPKSSS